MRTRVAAQSLSFSMQKSTAGAMISIAQKKPHEVFDAGLRFSISQRRLTAHVLASQLSIYLTLIIQRLSF
jgi:hypothetical protein